MSEFLMPSLGADMESAVLMEWKVKVGDLVTKGQVIAEIETSKGVIEIEVFEDGIIEKILIEPETECAVGKPLAMIRAVGESSDKGQPGQSAQTVEKPKEDLSCPKPLAVPSKKAIGAAQAHETSQKKRIKASPAARRKARELGLDLADIASEPEKELHLSQIETAARRVHKAPATLDMRQAIAAAMSRSNAEIPHYYLSASINMTVALTWLEELNKKFSIKKRILPAALLIHAVVWALKEIPQLNGFWLDGAQQISKEIHPGIAIALRRGGLITPALLGANEMNLEQTMQALSNLILRTRAGKLRGAELTQQTITITNLGDLGVECVYGIIYPPQVAIVGLGRIIDSPWVLDGNLTIQKVIQVTLSGDHRATDGRTGALFLEKLNHLLQNPEKLL